MRDSYGRDITYLRISVTDRCNLRCRYCMPEEGIPLLGHNDILSYERITEVAAAAIKIGVRKIRLTGGEPLARKGIVQLVKKLAAIPGVETLAMTTNGTLLSRYAGELADAGLDSVNVSLDTLNPERYEYLTRGGALQDALDGIDAALQVGLPVKINVVVMEDTSPEDLETLRDFAKSKRLALQTIAHYSLQEEKQDGGEFERPPPCHACNRLRLMANGKLRSCLHSDIDFDIDFNDIEKSLREAILAKPIRGAVSSTLSVGQIGG